MNTDIFLALLSFLLAPFKKTEQKIHEWLKKLRRLKYLYSAEEINEQIANYDSIQIESNRRLDGTILSDRYSKEMHVFRIEDKNGKRTIRIPYQEMVNFNQSPDTKIRISNSPEDPLLLKKEFVLPEDLEKATDVSLQEVLRESPKTTNDWHTRLTSLREVGTDEYECTLEKTRYYQQIRTNLSMDRHIEYKGKRTTIRDLELGLNDSSQGLTPLEESLLANVIGVSAIWCMGDLADPRFYLMPRNSSVGVYKNRLGMPSGDIECPQSSRFRFRDDSLIDFLTWEIAREFAEETGIADINRKFSLYSIPIDEERIRYRTEMEIIPLAFVREMLRGGKPQMFFLIRTKRISEKQLRKCFKKSLGITEFSNSLLTTASLSAEVVCNYLYAQEYMQDNPYFIDVR